MYELLFIDNRLIFMVHFMLYLPVEVKVSVVSVTSGVVGPVTSGTVVFTYIGSKIKLKV